jgi:hypothetical protein
MTPTEHPYDRHQRLNPPMTADELDLAISRTNNGYLFAPTGRMVECARHNPERFTTRPSTLGNLIIHPRK